MKIEELLEQIELVRDELKEYLEENNSLIDDEIITISQKLDKLLNKYYEIKGIENIYRVIKLCLQFVRYYIII